MLASDDWRRQGARLVLGLPSSLSVCSSIAAVAVDPVSLDSATADEWVHDVDDVWYVRLVLRTLLVVTDDVDVFRLLTIDESSSI